MKLYFMKQSAVDYMKANMTTLYIHYYRQRTNDWLYEVFDDDPFELFMEIPDFELAPYSDKKGEMDLENCKIIYSKLKNISESQASDERLWAGLCHTTFYAYVRNRWNYQTRKLTVTDKDASALISRFFFSGGTRSGFYRNTLARYWWVGHAVYQDGAENKFELLDFLGSEDFSTKVSDLFYSNTFSSNLNIIKGICKGWRIFTDRGIKLPVKDYFRPALQNMNALGGGILLDVLNENEIKDIFFDYVYHLYSKDRPNAIVFEAETTEDSEEIDSADDEMNEDIQSMQEEFEQDKNDIENTGDIEDIDRRNIIGVRTLEETADARKFNKMMGKPSEVTYKCSVSIYRPSDGKTLQYVLPGENDDGWFPIMKLLIGKHINDEVIQLGRKYIITDIGW